ncbi:MAG TPA: hypothetical protein VIF88_12195 [Methylocystis sp.]|jgi:hypothetical protein
MITLTHCAKLANLDRDALVVGLTPNARHHALLKSYLFNAHRGHAEALRMMIRDLRGCLDSGADRCAADLLIVLRLFLSRRHEMVRASRRQAIIGADRRVVSRHRSTPSTPRRERAATPLKTASR